MKKKDIYKAKAAITILWVSILLYSGCDKVQNFNNKSDTVNIMFLHHSTGRVILRGDQSRILLKLGFDGGVSKYLSTYNKRQGTNYVLQEQLFPKEEVYGWNNYPYDYYNIWVKNAGNEPYMDEPTLEMLTKEYNLIIFKHCFPVSNIVQPTEPADINSEIKTIDNYKLQYQALKEKLKQFPNTRFLVWTGAALVSGETTEENAQRAKEFFDWVVNDWDETGDNIYIWDFRSLETEGGLYLLDKHASSLKDSHPNTGFAGMAATLLAERIIDVLEDRGDSTDITGVSNN